MSHVVGCQIPLDLESIAAACAELGFTFVPNATSYKWFGRWVGDSEELFPWVEMFGASRAAEIRAMPRSEKSAYMSAFLGTCEHKITVPGCDYEVAVIRRPSDGALTVVWDAWAPHGGEKLTAAMGGTNAALFAARCAVAKVKATAQRLGFRVSERAAATQGVR